MGQADSRRAEQRKAYNAALLKEAAKLQEGMAKKKDSFRAKQPKKEAAPGLRA